MYYVSGNIEIFVVIIFGAMFGYFLEVSGLGSPKKLNAQFTLKDWSVFKVMFTSIVVASIGLWLLSLFELVDYSTMRISTTYFWAMLIGGALLGIGLSIGGYCPGTSVVGLFSGRIDALFFMLGIVIGTVIFASSFDFLKPLYMAGEGPARQRLYELVDLPVWVVLIALVIIAVVGFRIGNKFEAKNNSVITSKDLNDDANF
ncbi:DUF6691 family protein [Sulfurimonas sp. CS5]|jgi:hypothetical protein|uniref:DUF6691 family protein n=1 Tax=Sulfurimonas sp. CS5 TaxID=3391145 RepID=UPI0039E9D06A